jgi:hypothetical protein
MAGIFSAMAGRLSSVARIFSTMTGRRSRLPRIVWPAVLLIFFHGRTFLDGRAELGIEPRKPDV